ncbi:hypothetical protein M378DRAFT_11114 [Amanita muscaria Koide BX008]|uniref:Deoxyribonuclease NucA/NucB domain-containing protein n=1 Tax=Amanita muscaria (strain Koide BX008) TaxID=946122 RepID=A0A0C2WTH7_AMAMK|nr:hypothetical protein M378DRAFT_11114 [Amanita muscaria Koide BX008]
MRVAHQPLTYVQDAIKVKLAAYLKDLTFSSAGELISAVHKTPKPVGAQPAAKQGKFMWKNNADAVTLVVHAVQRPKQTLVVDLESLAAAMAVAPAVKYVNEENASQKTPIVIDLLNSGKVVRFELDWEKNGLLLRNMCNGMQGKNTETLTYSGKLSNSEKAQKRRDAGCVRGYCRGMINSGTISSDLNSCDEYPPANSDEGGGARPTIETAVNCIPGSQNSFQGSMFSNMMQRSKIQAGEEYVISIDCEEVLNSLVPPRTLIETRHEPKRVVLKTRDSVSMSGKTDSNNTFLLPNETMTSISAPFGDLDPGSYVAVAQVVSGSTANAIVIANEGDNYTNGFLGMASGESQQFTFTLDYSDVGLGIIFGSTDNTTIINWTLEGSLSPSGSSSLSGTASSTAGGPSGFPTVRSDALSLSLELFWIGLVDRYLLTINQLFGVYRTGGRSVVAASRQSDPTLRSNPAPAETLDMNVFGVGDADNRERGPDRECPNSECRIWTSCGFDATSYLIDAPPLISPGLAELLENVSHKMLPTKNGSWRTPRTPFVPKTAVAFASSSSTATRICSVVEVWRVVEAPNSG